MANDRQIALQIVANDLASATVQRVNDKIRLLKATSVDVAGAMSFATSGTAKWEEGLRRLAIQTENATKATGGEGTGFRGGLAKAGRAMERFAGDLLGVNNQVGNFAEGILEFAGGGALVTGVAAGIIAIGAAFLYFTKQAREAKKAYDDYIKSLQKDTPLSIVGAQLDSVREQLAKAENQQAYEIEVVGSATSETTKRVADLRRQVGLLEGQYQDLRDALKDVHDQSLFDAGLNNVGPTKGGASLLNTQTLSVITDAVSWAIRGIITTNRNQGALTDRTRQGASAEEQAASIAAANAATTQSFAMIGVGGEVAAKHMLSFAEVMDRVAESTLAVGDALAAINNSLLGSIPGFGQVAKAAQKAVQVVAKVEGAIAIAKGAVKVAESIWPFNPAGLASGTKMIVEGARLSALGGGSGSASSASGGGAGSGSSYQQSQQQLAAQRDKVTVILPPIIPTTDTGVQDWLAQLIRDGAGRDVTFQVGVA